MKNLFYAAFFLFSITAVNANNQLPTATETQLAKRISKGWHCHLVDYPGLNKNIKKHEFQKRRFTIGQLRDYAAQIEKNRFSIFIGNKWIEQSVAIPKGAGADTIKTLLNAIKLKKKAKIKAKKTGRKAKKQAHRIKKKSKHKTKKIKRKAKKARKKYKGSWKDVRP